jgi:hypothetical protein
MIDQLHAFDSPEAANAAFPRPLDDDGNPINAPCWMIDGATVLPLTVFVMDGDTVRPSTETWIGLSCLETDADALWALPSAQVELSRPNKPTFWTECVTRSRVPAEAASAVMGVSPMFSGSAYLFPEWPAE